jgi:hypothetical protein
MAAARIVTPQHGGQDVPDSCGLVVCSGHGVAVVSRPPRRLRPGVLRAAALRAAPTRGRRGAPKFLNGFGALHRGPESGVHPKQRLVAPIPNPVVGLGVAIAIAACELRRLPVARQRHRVFLPAGGVAASRRDRGTGSDAKTTEPAAQRIIPPPRRFGKPAARNSACVARINSAISSRGVGQFPAWAPVDMKRKTLGRHGKAGMARQGLSGQDEARRGEAWPAKTKARSGNASGLFLRHRDGHPS